MRASTTGNVAASFATLVLALSLATTPGRAVENHNHANTAHHAAAPHQGGGRHVGASYASGWRGDRSHNERFRHDGYQQRSYAPGYYNQGNYDQGGYEGPGYGPDIGLGIMGGIFGAAAGAIGQNY